MTKEQTIDRIKRFYDYYAEGGDYKFPPVLPSRQPYSACGLCPPNDGWSNPPQLFFVSYPDGKRTEFKLEDIPESFLGGVWSVIQQILTAKFTAKKDGILKDLSAFIDAIQRNDRQFLAERLLFSATGDYAGRNDFIFTDPSGENIATRIMDLYTDYTAEERFQNCNGFDVWDAD